MPQQIIAVMIVVTGDTYFLSPVSEIWIENDKSY